LISAAAVFEPEICRERIISFEKKCELLSDLGIEKIYVFYLTESFRNTSPEDFVKLWLSEKLGASEIICGFNYTFGKNKQGNAKLLAEFSEKYGFSLTVKESVEIEGIIVSSTEIPKLLANGYTGDTVCKDCGKTVVRGTVITTNGHSYGDWVIVEEATVNGPGKKTKTCSVCQNVLTEVIEQLPPPQCDHPGTEILNYKKSTCSETGYSGDKCCTECGLILEKGKTILSVAHTYGEWEITKEPTATEVGQKKASCTVCGKTKTDFVPTLPPCDHSETEIRDAANADCGNNGYSGDTYCTLCGELVSEGTETSPSGEHTYGEWEVLQFATPDKFGKQIRKCEVCDHIESSVLVYVEPDNTNTVAIVIISASAGVALLATAAVIVIVKRKKQH
jgi:hypothetical protein